MKRYRIMTDGVNLIDGYIINIGVNFAITVYKGYTKKDVLSECIQTIQNFFNIDNWNFSQPINLSQLELEIAKVEGVQSIVNLEIINKTTLDGNYSAVEYDISSATKNNIIYPSTDPSCWEIKYPNSDIIGRCS
jgi:phage-related baseplate assembly protein